MITGDDVVKLSQVFATKEEFRLMEERMTEKFATKDQWNLVMNLVDKVLVEVKAMREEQAVHFSIHEEVNQRLDKLESVTGISH